MWSWTSSSWSQATKTSNRPSQMKTKRLYGRLGLVTFVGTFAATQHRITTLYRTSYTRNAKQKSGVLFVPQPDLNFAQIKCTLMRFTTTELWMNLVGRQKVKLFVRKAIKNCVIWGSKKTNCTAHRIQMSCQVFLGSKGTNLKTSHRKVTRLLFALIPTVLVKFAEETVQAVLQREDVKAVPVVTENV